MIMPLYDDNSVVQDGVDVGNEALFAVWQTEEWTPTPVGPQDPIPVNEFNNIELALLNPGLAHVEIRGASKVAKKLGIPYAPCLTGFEGHGGTEHPPFKVLLFMHTTRTSSDQRRVNLYSSRLLLKWNVEGNLYLFDGRN